MSTSEDNAYSVGEWLSYNVTAIISEYRKYKNLYDLYSFAKHMAYDNFKHRLNSEELAIVFKDERVETILDFYFGENDEENKIH